MRKVWMRKWESERERERVSDRRRWRGVERSERSVKGGMGRRETDRSSKREKRNKDEKNEANRNKIWEGGGETGTTKM